jgi:hydroxymethylbilane synthase
MKEHFLIGTRGSKLALTQAEWVAAQIRKHCPDLEIKTKIYKTQGDKILDVPLSSVEGKSFFTKELEEALLEKEIDMVVHSAKDLPTTLPEGLTLASIPKRESPSDCLIAAKTTSLDALPDGARVGTSSLRRQAQLLEKNPKLTMVDMRGNIDTRLKKLDAGEYDVILLAEAGLKRLDLIREREGVVSLNPTEFLPAPSQGALAIEIREDNLEVKKIVRTIHHEESSLQVRAERAFLKCLEGGCQVPAGVYTQIQGDDITMVGGIFSRDGSRAVRWTTHGPKENPEAVGHHLAEWLLQSGGKEILEEIRHV